MEFGYQWIANDGNSDTDIDDATDSTYKPSVSDVGKTIKVKVSLTDDAENEETLTSEATEAVAAKPNSEATGLPTITGTPQVDETLTASTSAINDEDGLEDVSYSYQWIANDGNNDTDIDDATDSTYTPSVSDVGKTIKVKASFTDDANNAETLTSQATVAVAAAPNREATGKPAIGGTPQVEQTLTADTSPIDDEDGLEDVSYSYQWIANDGNNDTDIPDATDTTYTLTVDDVGKTIQVKVSFTDDAENEETLTSEATEAVDATVPTQPLSLTVATGDQTQKLDASWQAPSSNGGSGVTGYKLQWKESADIWETPTEVSEATVTGTVHTITGLTDGVEYSVRVSAVNDAGQGPPSTEASGTPQEASIWSATLTVGTAETFAGYTTFLTAGESNILGALSADTFTSDNDSYTVKALGVLDGKLILSVTPKLSSGFVLMAGTTEFASTNASTRVNHSLIQFLWTDSGLDWSDVEEVAVRLTKSDEDSAATGAPTISGTPQVEQTLTASTSEIDDEDGLTNVSYEYQWIAGGSDIDGATGSTYTLTYSEQGKTIQVRVTFTDDADNEESLTSQATVAVAAAPNREATGEPAIGGTPQVDQTLTADTSPIDDADGLEAVSYEYQWIRSDNGAGSDIAEATEASYTLVFADQGKTIKVKVTFTDDAENEEILTSEATGTVAAAPNRAATGDPTISGTPQVNQTLTAGTAAISDEDGLDGLSYEYQWTADDTDLDEATEATYTPSTEDAGKTIKVKVSFTDDRNNDESRTSAATSAVLATVPGQPHSLTVTAGDDIQELDASWQAPSSNGGSSITGYKVQWKRSADSWDTEADVFQAIVTGTTHTIPGLTGGVEYAVRVIASNTAGDGPASTEVKGTPAGAVSEQVVEPENSAPTGLPGISGTPQVDQTLTADTSPIDDEDGLTNVSYRYQWIAGGSDIEGATGSTYTLTAREQGLSVLVRVSFTDDADNQETLTSAATAAVAARPNSPPTGAPTISGTAQSGETLTADVSGVADADGLANVSYSYQWIRIDGNSDSDIPGATDTTYTLVSADEGKTIKVRVSFTDDADNQETLTSTTTVIVDQPGAVSLWPELPRVGTVVSATLTDPDGLEGAGAGAAASLGALSWQWSRSSEGSTWTSFDVGQDGNSYTPTGDDEGMWLKVTAVYTDGHGRGKSAEAITAATIGAREASAGADGHGTRHRVDASLGYRLYTRWNNAVHRAGRRAESSAPRRHCSAGHCGLQ